MQTKLDVKVYSKSMSPMLEPATTGAACFDIRALEVTYSGHEPTVLVSTGLHFEIPEGHAMLIFARSGLAFKYGMQLVNCVAVIDSDYRGEVMLKFIQNFPSMMNIPQIQPGDRVAQGMILPIPALAFVMVPELSMLGSTDRGEGGFGSTGVE